jgi:hypothetical protein
MQRSQSFRIISALTLLIASSTAVADPMEINCSLRSGGTNLECQVVGKERKAMTPDDVANFIDAAETSAYITLRSKRGKERVFLVDATTPQFKKLNEVKRSNAVSAIARAKSDLFDEIEKRVIKISDDLDTRTAEADLIQSDPSIGYDKFKRETRKMTAELDGFKKERDKICTSTPAFEQLTKSRAGLQQTLSNILYAFQSSGTCMSDYKVFKDKDGTVDLRQLNDVSDVYKNQCKKN